jgi:hypothetical protein
LGVEELAPGRPAMARRRLQSGAVQDPSDAAW